MKKIIVFLFLLFLLPTICFGFDNSRDRRWRINDGTTDRTDNGTPITVNATAVRETIPRDGVLWIQATGADCYIGFNATANVSSIKISQDGDIDFERISVLKNEYFTIYSAGGATLNYIISD